MPQAPKFATDWRKRVACHSCRKSKIRCEFSSPQAQSCKPCLRKGVECQMPTSFRSKLLSDEFGRDMDSPPSDLEDGVFAKLTTKAATTPEECRAKLQQLELIAQDVEQEIEELKIIERTRPSPPVQMDWGSDVLQRRDCINAAVEVGLLTLTAAAWHFKNFIENMRIFVPVHFEFENNFIHLSKVRPVQALAAIVCSRACMRDADIPEEAQTASPDALIIFVERVTQERVFSRASQGPEVINALLLMAVYCQPTPQPKIPNYISMAITCSISTDMGSAADIARYKENPSSYDNAEPLRAYAALRMCAIGVVTRDMVPQILGMLPRMTEVCDALYNYGEPIDKFIADCGYMNVEVARGIQLLLATKNKPFKVIEDTLNAQTAAMDAVVKDAGIVSDAYFGSESIRKWFKLTEYSCLIDETEIAMNHIMFNSTQVAVLEDIRQLGMNIMDYAQSMINNFLDVSSTRPKMPQWLFFRPLQGISALLRLRFVFWSFGMEYDMEIETYYKRVKDSWKRLRDTEGINEKLFDALVLIEKWLKIRVQKFDTEEKVLPYSEFFHSFMRDAIIFGSREELNRTVEVEISKSAAQSPASNIAVSPSSFGVSPGPYSPRDVQRELPQPPAAPPGPMLVFEETPPAIPMDLISDDPNSGDWEVMMNQFNVQETAKLADPDELLRQLFGGGI